MLSKLLQERPNCYFVSPHLEDATFSAVGLMNYLVKNKVPVVLVNIFTAANEPSTRAARKFLHECGFKTAEDLFSARLQEDGVVAKKLKITKHDLGFTDALWRKKEKMSSTGRIVGKLFTESLHVYPSYQNKVQPGNVSSNDIGLHNKIQNKLKTIIGKSKNTVLFCPIAIGKHIDHIIVRDSVKLLNRKTVYWTDYPYSLKYNDQEKFVNENSLKKFLFSDFDPKFKQEMIKTYKTQFKSTFPEGKIVLPAELYFYNNE